MKKSNSIWGVLPVLLAVLLSACGGGGGGGGGSSSGGTPPPQTTGSVTGALNVSNVILPLSLSATAVVTTQPNSSSNITEDFVPGEIIVRFKDGIDETATLAVILDKNRDIGLVNAGPIYPNGPYLLRTDAHQNKNISISDAKKQTKDAILRLKAEPAVQYVELNDIHHAKLMPNEPVFGLGLQWDMSMINLPAAWEITTGSPSVIVAVLDTGIRSHPDLDPNVLSTGFNFVGMNSDPTEPLSPFAHFHGTHVAGTIAAVGNNGFGMAGVAWNAKIMPVRVLAELGGSTVSIINGMLYAAGLPNSSGKIPPQRANVINMSLGGQGPCTQTFQDTINKVINAGVVIVVSAGNSGQQEQGMNPASCIDVIAVGAVDPSIQKATYSSYSMSHPYVSIVAPGGEMSDGIHAGILSTLPATVSGSNQTFKFMQGTSMAAPHVSGVVALMFSVNPNLSPAQVKTILATTATPLSVTVPSPDTGYGLIDAGMAVAQAKGVPTPSVPIPYPRPSLANFKRISVPMLWKTTISNFGGKTLSLSAATTFVGNPVGGTWLSVTRDPLCASIAAFSDCMLTINVDPTGLPADEYYGAVIVTSNAGVFAILVVFQAGASPSPPPLGPMAVQLWGIDSTSSKLTGLVSTITTPVVSQSYNYTFTDISPGCYVVVAGVDKNGDGVFGDAPNEVFTNVDPKQVCVTAGKTTNGIDLPVKQEQEDILDNL